MTLTASIFFHDRWSLAIQDGSRLSLKFLTCE
jgi:hypothetical protein